MKNNKAVFLIILGAFLLVTGFAFAGSYDQLKSNPFGDGKSASFSPANTNSGGLTLKAATPAPAPTPAPAKPTVGETIKKFLTDNARNIMIGGIGAYLGFVLLGPAGLVLGALAFLWLGTL
ncbi:MAG: hypothetical protein HY550_03795 [Elusimicrobia bacterium]|nr:hypothetical protein [Elusimicrobiota bacterium]